MSETIEPGPARPIAGAVRRERVKRRGRPLASGASIGRETLVAVTREILRETPVGEVTRLMIAERANVDPNLIRYYFGTVPHLIAEVVLGTHRELQQRMRDVLAVDDPLESLRAKVEHLIDLFIDNPFHHQLIRQVMYQDRGSYEYEEWSTSLATSIEHSGRVIEMGARQGMFRAVDHRFLHLVLVSIGEFFGSNADLVSDMYGGGGTVASLRDRYVDFVLDILVRGIGPERGERA